MILVESFDGSFKRMSDPVPEALHFRSDHLKLKRQVSELIEIGAIIGRA